jgi:hypothetical protein
MTNLACPHCLRRIESVEDHNCSPIGMSRRFFFGLLAGATAAAAIPSIWARKGIESLIDGARLFPGDLIYRLDRGLVHVGFGPDSLFPNFEARHVVVPPIRIASKVAPIDWDHVVYRKSPIVDQPLMVARDVRPLPWKARPRA